VVIMRGMPYSPVTVAAAAAAAAAAALSATSAALESDSWIVFKACAPNNASLLASSAFAAWSTTVSNRYSRETLFFCNSAACEFVSCCCDGRSASRLCLTSRKFRRTNFHRHCDASPHPPIHFIQAR